MREKIGEEIRDRGNGRQTIRETEEAREAKIKSKKEEGHIQMWGL